MSAKLDLTGHRYGELTVVSEVPNRPHRYWVCRCDCGETPSVRGYNLRSGAVASCGVCTKKRHRHPRWNGYEELSGDVWCTYRQNAVRRGIAFAITIAYAWDLFLKQERRCALTGLPLAFTRENKKWTTHTASIDRIDSSRGYVEGNVHWVHKEVNRMKGSMSVDDFVAMCRHVHRHDQFTKILAG